MGGGGGAVDTNDWCITGRTILSLPGDSITYLISFKTRFELADAVRAITDRDGTNALSSPTSENSGLNATQVWIQRGGQGVRTPPPPGKSQVIWVSIGNKQLDLPWKKLDPPGKCWPTLEP